MMVDHGHVGDPRTALIPHKACDCSRRLRYTNKSGQKFGGNSKSYLPLGIYS